LHDLSNRRERKKGAVQRKKRSEECNIAQGTKQRSVGGRHSYRGDFSTQKGHQNSFNNECNEKTKGNDGTVCNPFRVCVRLKNKISSSHFLLNLLCPSAKKKTNGPSRVSSKMFDSRMTTYAQETFPVSPESPFVTENIDLSVREKEMGKCPVNAAPAE